MKISGFSMARNAVKLYYPVAEMIKSVLPLVDEFVIAVGKGDEDDNTKEQIEAIDDPKIKIIDTKWDIEKYPRGMEHAHQTDIAKNACSGDWLFYLQADEVVHEKHLPVIKKRCMELKDKKEVEGLLFKYIHFWGDYNHYHLNHAWYPREIRIIRNDPDIHSWVSAQSFRRIPDFDGVSYRNKKNTSKLRVAAVDAYIYHYGWVRPPHLMQSKKKYFNISHRGKKRADEIYNRSPKEFDYGPLDRLKRFRGTQPSVMKGKIEEMDWEDKLQYSGKINPYRARYKHEKLKYRLLTFIEQNITGGKQIGGYSNYRLIDV